MTYMNRVKGPFDRMYYDARGENGGLDSMSTNGHGRNIPVVYNDAVGREHKLVTKIANVVAATIILAGIFLCVASVLAVIAASVKILFFM